MKTRFLSIISVLVLLGQFSVAQERAVGNMAAERKIALVIGNANYEARIGKLENTLNDAADMKSALQLLGFEVISCRDKADQIIPCVDLDKRAMERAIRDFGQKLTEKQDAVGLFYYAGHGLQLKGQNYLIPFNVDIRDETDVGYEGVSLEFVLDKLAAAKSALNFVILDACRNNPFAKNWTNARDIGDSGGLAKPNSLGRNTTIVYSAEPNKTANDGKERNGVFTKYLLRHIATPDLEYADLMLLITNDVLRESAQTQKPWVENPPSRKFYFNKLKNAAGAPLQPSYPPAFNGVITLIPIPEINIKKAEQIAQVGDELLDKDEIKLALSNFDDAIKLNPNSDYAYAKRGECYRSLGNLSQAFTDLNEAIRKNPKNDFAYLSRGAAYQDSGENDLAFKDLNESIRLKNDNVWAYHNRGNLYVRIKNCRQALIDLSKAISIKPESVRGYLSRSDAYLCTKNVNAALGDIDTALKIDSRHKDAVLKRARLLTKLARFEDAKAEYGKLIEIDPQEAEGYLFMRAMIGFSQMAAAFEEANSGKSRVYFPDVFTELTKIIELDGKLKAVSYSLRGMSYAFLGDIKAAEKDLDTAVQVGRNDNMNLILAYFLRCLYYVQAKKYKYAQADLDSISKLDFGDDETKKTVARAIVHINRSTILSAKGNNKDALTEINSAIALSPSGFMYLIRAEIYERLKRFDEAGTDRLKAQEVGVDDDW
jgi:uncharacterized caspase-like protein/tetratricopeptide (TPR) repeat protein